MPCFVGAEQHWHAKAGALLLRMLILELLESMQND